MTTRLSLQTDDGSVVRSDQAALVADADGSLSILLPTYQPGSEIPDAVRLLGAVLVRSSDPEWVAEMLTVYDDLH